MAMNSQGEAAIEVSFPRALIFSAILMLCFVAGLFAMGIPMHDPLLIAFLLVMVPAMTFAFAISFFYMFRAKISSEGLRSAVPGFYQTILRWNDVASVRRATGGGIFYIVKGRRIDEFCILPRPFLLKNPASVRRLIEQYAPAGNILRKELAR